MALPKWIKEARGSAVWDGIKWLWGAGGAFVSTVVHAVVGFLTGHPDLASLLITGFTAVFLGIVALIMFRTRAKPVAVEGLVMVEQQPGWQPRADSPEARDYNMLRNKFYDLKWTQQATLDLLYRRLSGGVPPDSLRQALLQRGFGPDLAESMLVSLTKTQFVEVSGDGTISPHPARLSLVRGLLDAWRKQGI